MRSCPSDPEEEEDGGHPGVPLTQPVRGGDGGGGGCPLGDPPRVRGQPCALWQHMMMCCGSAGGVGELRVN